MRMQSKGAPLKYHCDGEIHACPDNPSGGCPDRAKIATKHYGWNPSLEAIKEQGWICHPSKFGAHGGFAHACPNCYLEYCRRAEVEPYERSDVIVTLSKGVLMRNADVLEYWTNTSAAVKRRRAIPDEYEEEIPFELPRYRRNRY